MKGLLIKDFKLLKVQKNSFLLILCIAIGMEIFTNSTSSSFIIGYLSFVATLFTLSSISYDEFDNGNAFLFSLPITRKSYVIEKYGFGMIMGSSFWAFGTLIVILKEIIAMKYVSIDTIMAAFIILPIVVQCNKMQIEENLTVETKQHHFFQSRHFVMHLPSDCRFRLIRYKSSFVRPMGQSLRFYPENDEHFA